MYQQDDIEAKNPPQYSEAMSAPTGDTPPSYESLNFMNRLKRVKEESSSPAHFVSSVLTIICGSVVVTVLFALSICLPISMIIIGVIYKDNCPIQTKIPIW
jgi:hypothetical protein